MIFHSIVGVSISVRFSCIVFKKLIFNYIYDSACNLYRFRVIRMSINVCIRPTIFFLSFKNGVLLQFTNRILLFKCKFYEVFIIAVSDPRTVYFYSYIVRPMLSLIFIIVVVPYIRFITTSSATISSLEFIHIPFVTTII